MSPGFSRVPPFRIFNEVIKISNFTTIKNTAFFKLKKYEAAHDKIYNKTCATSEDSDQSAHPRSLISLC